MTVVAGGVSGTDAFAVDAVEYADAFVATGQDIATAWSVATGSDPTGKTMTAA